jgi:hypothetical protein
LLMDIPLGKQCQRVVDIAVHPFSHAVKMANSWRLAIANQNRCLVTGSL